MTVRRSTNTSRPTRSSVGPFVQSSWGFPDSRLRQAVSDEVADLGVARTQIHRHAPVEGVPCSADALLLEEIRADVNAEQFFVGFVGEVTAVSNDRLAALDHADRTRLISGAGSKVRGQFVERRRVGPLQIGERRIAVRDDVRLAVVLDQADVGQSREAVVVQGEEGSFESVLEFAPIDQRHVAADEPFRQRLRVEGFARVLEDGQHRPVLRTVEQAGPFFRR